MTAAKATSELIGCLVEAPTKYTASNEYFPSFDEQIRLRARPGASLSDFDNINRLTGSETKQLYLTR